MTDDTSPENLRKFLESDDPALVRMGLSMAKGSGVPDELLGLIAGLYMWDDDKTVRAAAKSTFMKQAPEHVKKSVEETWKAKYRTLKTCYKGLEDGETLREKLDTMCMRFKDSHLNSTDTWRPALTRTMGSKNAIKEFSNVSNKIVMILADFGTTDAIELLIRYYGDLVKVYDFVKDRAFLEIGEALVQPLIKSLGDDDWGIRKSAAIALGKMGGGLPYVHYPEGISLNLTRAVVPLIKALEDDNDDVREEVVKALGQIGDARAVEPLIKALGDEDWSVRASAVGALGKIGDARAVVPLIKALEDEYHREGAAKALGEIGDARAVEPLIKALEDDEIEVRKAAVATLVMIGDERAVEPLIGLLSDDDRRVCGPAAEALGKIGDERAVEPLIKALDDGGDVHYYAVWALGEIGDARAVDPLIEVLGSNYYITRKSATKALGEIGDERAVEPLIKALGDDNADVRGGAAEALGKIRDTHAVEPLIKALEDEDWSVREGAAEALKKLGHEVE